MLIGFVGDVHGCILDAVAAVVTLQRRMGRQFDLVVQVGDMGAFPDLNVDESAAIYIALDPRQSDFARLIGADESLVAAVRRVRAELRAPIHFLRGNHEDFSWLAGLAVDSASGSARVDDTDLLRYVPDGHRMHVAGVRIAFLGGVEELSGPPGFDPVSYGELLSLGPGAVDVLITHEGPYGSSVGYRGDTHGSPMITRLLDRLRPSFHVAGHAHQLSGPATYVETTYLGLDGLVPSRRWYPEARGLNPGCLGVLDTDRGSLEPVTDAWLTEFETPFDFEAWASRLPS